jgi:hypothetical protein
LTERVERRTIISAVPHQPVNGYHEHGSHVRAKKPPQYQRHHTSDHYQSPGWVLDPLLPYLDPTWIVWEPACGQGNLVRRLTAAGHDVLASDILQGPQFDFLRYTPGFPYEMICSNPPFSYKNQFIQRCYDLGKPWAMLMPLTALATATRHNLYKQHGIELLLLPTRVKFRRDDQTQKQPPSAVAWFTWKILPHPLIFS